MSCSSCGHAARANAGHINNLAGYGLGGPVLVNTTLMIWQGIYTNYLTIGLQVFRNRDSFLQKHFGKGRYFDWFCKPQFFISNLQETEFSRGVCQTKY